jgi:hypothetical protein
MPIIILLIVHGLAVFKMSHQKSIFLPRNFEGQSSFKSNVKSKSPVSQDSEKKQLFKTPI